MKYRHTFLHHILGFSPAGWIEPVRRSNGDELPLRHLQPSRLRPTHAMRYRRRRANAPDAKAAHALSK